jgi:(2S)-methylsuccinyl-CoA dehydrogenase
MTEVNVQDIAPRSNILAACGKALDAVGCYLDAVLTELRGRVTVDGKLDREALTSAQQAVHGCAWAVTYFFALRQLLGWAQAASAEPREAPWRTAIAELVFREYVAQLIGGLPISQTEIVRPRDFGIRGGVVHALTAAQSLLSEAATPDLQRILLRAMQSHDLFATTEEAEELGIMRDQFARYAANRIAPMTRNWHAGNELIPAAVIEELAELGAFSITIPADCEGLAMGKLPMCLVTEELARTSLAAASLGTRAEIAAELIALHGTPEQRRRFLPDIATGKVFPAAVFTEPDTGSDLAHIRTRAEPHAGGYRIFGSKTWSTHAARAHLLLILARTDPTQRGAEGLSLFLAVKPPGNDQDPFPVPGLSGSEIPVIGYRGMREYELGFDGFAVDEQALLGGRAGQGFRQLMSTFESARIQTAARAVGVARGCFDLGFSYARQRRQFGRPILEFPRIHGKLVWMAAETIAARELTYFAARRKDRGVRCDVEAGMAKLLAARVAWSNADCALQIHGGNGYAEEYPISRMLCDARVLSIFEGAAEIQADVIGKGLLTGRIALDLTPERAEP